jgi:aspartate ammonia-lyase
VIGNDVTISMAAEAGQLELNVMEPVIFFNLNRNIEILTNGCLTLARRAIAGMTANADVCRRYVEQSIGIVTALNPVIGYEQAADIAKEALATGRTVADLAIEKGHISREQLDELLRPETMLRPFRRVPREKP